MKSKIALLFSVVAIIMLSWEAYIDCYFYYNFPYSYKDHIDTRLVQGEFLGGCYEEGQSNLRSKEIKACFKKPRFIPADLERMRNSGGADLEYYCENGENGIRIKFQISQYDGHIECGYKKYDRALGFRSVEIKDAIYVGDDGPPFVVIVLNKLHSILN